MTNDKYILCGLGKVKNNAFMVDFELKLILHDILITGSAKIDTGCESTSISLQSWAVGMKSPRALSLKQDAINSGLNARVSFGVSDNVNSRNTQRRIYKSGNLMECSAVKFDNPISDFSINGYELPNKFIGVSYDRTSNVLIGMDVLKDFDYHFGDSIIDDKIAGIHKGDHIFIGCLKTDINEEYLRALKKYLGYIPDYKRIEILIRNNNIADDSEFVKNNYTELEI